MARSKKTTLKSCAIATALILLGFILIIIYQGRSLAKPNRREIQPYHLEWLNNSSAHGISIQKTTQLGGLVPCLIVTPDAAAPLGERGKTLRKQIQELGHTPVPHGTILGNIVLLHGRNGRKEDLLPVAERFCAAGLRCIIPDLPAHGEATVQTVKFGASEWERDLPHDLLLECAKTHQFSPYPASLWGLSMGGSFATHSASTGAPWTSLIIVCSFDQLSNVIEKKSPSKLVYNLVNYSSKMQGGPNIEEVSPSIWAESVRTPVLVVHGTDDSLIDISLGRNLYDSFLSTDKKWISVEGANHNNILTTPMPLYSMMVDWILDQK